MTLRFLLPAALLAGGTAVALSADPGTTVLVSTTAVDDYSDLLVEYDEAVSAWKDAIKAAPNTKAKNELRRNHPAKSIWSRFEALAEKGEGKALLWMATHLREKGVSSSERGPIKSELYGRLVDQHADAAYLPDVLAGIVEDAKRIGDEGVLDLLARASKNATSEVTKPAATYHYGAALLESEGEEAKARGEKLLRAVVEDYPKTSWGTMARAQFITEEDVQPGKPAPDFYGESFDGHGFNLSDYRGKIVLLDFYGFW